MTEQTVVWHSDGGVRVFRDGRLYAEAPAKDADALVRGLPPLPGPVPASVSLRQLLRALAQAGFISRAEALAAARTGDIPASLAAPLLSAVDGDAAFEIQLAWAAMYEAERASPFWAYVVSAGIATDTQIDDVFRLATAS